MFSYGFNMLVLKLNLNKKYYHIFLNKKHFKINKYNTKYVFNMLVLKLNFTK
jgi:hypothetical protein